MREFGTDKGREGVKNPENLEDVICTCPLIGVIYHNMIILIAVGLYRVKKIGAPNDPCSRVAPSGWYRAEGATRESEHFAPISRIKSLINLHKSVGGEIHGKIS